MAPVTNYNKLSDLKQQKFTVTVSFLTEVQNQDVSRSIHPVEALADSCMLLPLLRTVGIPLLPWLTTRSFFGLSPESQISLYFSLIIRIFDINIGLLELSRMI